MDSALDKIGLYDFFGVFLSGMLVVVVSYYLDLPLVNLIENTDNDIINVIIVLLILIFYRRTQRFSTYKVRVILRHYTILNEKNT